MHIHAGRLLRRAPQVPVIRKMTWRLPGSDLAPLIFDAFRSALIDPAAHQALHKYAGARVSAARMLFGPPRIDLLGPGPKGLVHTTAHDNGLPHRIRRARRTHDSVPAWSSAARRKLANASSQKLST